jgi:hypothetical protein
MTTTDDLDHGGYYVLRGCEYDPLTAWFKDGRWFFVDETVANQYHVLMVDGDKLVVATSEGIIVSPTLFTLADVVPDSPEMALIGGRRDDEVDATANDLLVDVDI